MRKIKKLYEEAVNQENSYLQVYDNCPESLPILRETALKNLHLATREVETLKKVLDILEETVDKERILCYSIES